MNLKSTTILLAGTLAISPLALGAAHAGVPVSVERSGVARSPIAQVLQVPLPDYFQGIGGAQSAREGQSLPFHLAQQSITGSYDFSWSARNHDGDITVKGGVPSEAVQRFLTIRAGDGASVDLEIRRGAPTSFISSSIAALDAIRHLQSGTVTYANGNWTLKGVAADPAQKRDVLATLDVTVDTSNWQIDVRVAGSADTPAGLDDGSDTATMNANVSADASANAEQGGEQLSRDGSLSGDPTAAHPEPATQHESGKSAAKEPATQMAEAEASLPNANQTDSSRADAGEKAAPDAASFQWQAQRMADGRMRLSGAVPSEGVGNFLHARAGNGVRDITHVAPGAPDGFISTANAALSALRHLHSGRVSYAQGHWTLYGIADSGESRRDTLIALARSVDMDQWSTAISVQEPMVHSAPETGTANDATAQTGQTPPVAQADQPLAQPAEPEQGAAESSDAGDQAVASADSGMEAPENATEPVNMDYLFNALRADGGQIALSGMLPSAAFAAYAGKIASGAMLDGIEVAPGAPADMQINVITGLQALGQLQSGLLAYENGKWTLVGDALDAATADEVRARIRSLKNGADWKLDIALVPGLQICRKAIAEFASTRTILFAPASARLTEESRQNVEQLAQSLKRCPDAKVYVSGHTDSDGPADANMALSVARAEAVVNTLIDAGVDFRRLYAIGYGETMPIASNDTREGKAQNRRIIFEIEE